MGLHDNWEAELEGMRELRGILDYNFHGLDVSWKVTGNFGGESYVDFSRSPLNEASLFAELQSYRLPQVPTRGWAARTPLQGLERAWRRLSFHNLQSRHTEGI